jgi:chromatin remodeling complex protein RSC6
MIKQYNRRDINKDAQLHDVIFVKMSDMVQLFENLTQMAIDAGADPDKMVNEDE